MSQEEISQPLRLGKHLVTGYWRYILPNELLQLKYPDESRSACMSCPKVLSDSYRPDYRCCTYFPRVPNFALGFALLHSEEARDLIRELILKGFILPEGMVATPDLWADYITEVEEDRYGKSHTVLCPFLNQANGYCRIYSFRNSVCSTFFCLKDGGQAGESFWHELQELGSQCELAIGQWAMGEVGLSPDLYYERLNRLEPAKVARRKDRAWNRTALRSLWGRFFGQEEEFLIRTADMFRSHQDKLWDIANQVEIREASEFEKKSLSRVPARYRAEARAEMGDASAQETMPPWKIWNGLLSRHRVLWTVPGGLIQLAPGVVLPVNPDQTPDGLCHRAGKYRLELFRRADRRGSAEFCEYISRSEREALELFRQPVLVTFRLMQDLARVLGKDSDPFGFISNSFHKKVLVPYKASPCRSPE